MLLLAFAANELLTHRSPILAPRLFRVRIPPSLPHPQKKSLTISPLLGSRPLSNDLHKLPPRPSLFLQYVPSISPITKPTPHHHSIILPPRLLPSHRKLRYRGRCQVRIPLHPQRAVTPLTLRSSRLFVRLFVQDAAILAGRSPRRARFGPASLALDPRRAPDRVVRVGGHHAWVRADDPAQRRVEQVRSSPLLLSNFVYDGILDRAEKELYPLVAAVGVGCLFTVRPPPLKIRT